MGTVLYRRLRSTRFESRYHEAMLNLLLAADHIDGMVESVCGVFKISHPQYNILRILRGVHPEGYPCGEIAVRMLNRAPDITRRLDGLERDGLVVRDRLSTDRRVVVTRITDKGLALLESMQSGIGEVLQFIGTRLTEEEAVQLSHIAERLYDDD